MTDNTVPGPDWDKELQDLVESVEADQAAESAEADSASGSAGGAAGVSEPASGPVLDADLAELLAERTGDLQRLQAEYVNYKRRVDRDRDVARQRGIEAVVADLLPVLDGIDAARTHGELTEGAAMIASELEKVAAKYGLTAFGLSGDPFDPHIHEALLQIDRPGYPVTTVAEVYQRGYKLGDFVLRPARVGVADADPACEGAGDGQGAVGEPGVGEQSVGEPGVDGPGADEQHTAEQGSGEQHTGEQHTAGEPTGEQPTGQVAGEQHTDEVSDSDSPSNPASEQQ